MKTAITIGIVMLMLASGFIIFNYDRDDHGMKILNDDDYKEIGEVEVYGGNIDMEYQGPVPEGYDLEHFRKTGETIKEVEK